MSQIQLMTFSMLIYLRKVDFKLINYIKIIIYANFYIFTHNYFRYHLRKYRVFKKMVQDQQDYRKIMSDEI